MNDQELNRTYCYAGQAETRIDRMMIEGTFCKASVREVLASYSLEIILHIQDAFSRRDITTGDVQRVQEWIGEEIERCRSERT